MKREGVALTGREGKYWGGNKVCLAQGMGCRAHVLRFNGFGSVSMMKEREELCLCN